jgi:hypothetical protein
MGFHEDLQSQFEAEQRALLEERERQARIDRQAWLAIEMPKLRALVGEWFANVGAPRVQVHYGNRVVLQVTHRYKSGTPSTSEFVCAVWNIEGVAYWAFIGRNALKTPSTWNGVHRIYVRSDRGGDVTSVPANDRTQVIEAMAPAYDRVADAERIPADLYKLFPAVLWKFR